MLKRLSLLATQTAAPLISVLVILLCSRTTQGKSASQLMLVAELTCASHYIENTGTEDLIWIEIYKADRVADISLQQWLALTPADIVANVLNVPIDFVDSLKKEKQVLIA
jgi:hypothetical protein